MTQSKPLDENAAAQNALSAGDVQAVLCFLRPQDSKPYFHSTALTGGEAKLFFETEEHTVTISDMRPIADNFTLDKQGFELRIHETRAADLYDDDVIGSVYEREVEQLLMHATQANRVVIFDHTRRSDSTVGAANPDGLRGPAARVHVDYTVTSGPVRAKDVLGAEEVERILGSGGRIMQVNVWRPIKGPVQRSPLALGDAASINVDELVATDQLFADRVGEIYQVTHASHQQWFWVPGMNRDEVLLLKGWDSIDDGRARFSPHGAFQIPGQNPGAPPRESIETRTYLIFEG